MDFIAKKTELEVQKRHTTKMLEQANTAVQRANVLLIQVEANIRLMDSLIDQAAAEEKAKAAQAAAEATRNEAKKTEKEGSEEIKGEGKK